MELKPVFRGATARHYSLTVAGQSLSFISHQPAPGAFWSASSFDEAGESIALVEQHETECEALRELLVRTVPPRFKSSAMLEGDAIVAPAVHQLDESRRRIPIRSIVLACVLISLGLAFGMFAKPAAAAEVYPLITYAHTSDILRGPPLGSGYEPTTDYLGIGVTLVFRRVELDISHGLKSRDCNYIRESETGRGCKWESGSAVQMRWNPRFRRGRR